MLFSSSEPISRQIRIVEPYPLTRTFRVPSECDGLTIVAVMSMKFPFRDPSFWEVRVQKGFIEVEHEQVSGDHRVHQGSLVSHFTERVVEPSVPDEVQVLDVTDDFLFAYKPAPMPVHPGGRYNKNSLTGILEQQGYNDLRLTHRLDAVTSGVMILGRNRAFSASVMREFTAGRVRKRYLARVQGVPGEKEVVIDAPVRRKKGFVFESGADLAGGRDATTTFRLRSVLPDGSSIIECNPVTGRTHQIRLHLKHWGYPIIDDPIYGPAGDDSGHTLQSGAISLVSAALEIPEMGISHTLEYYRDILSSRA